ncbi:hypothetical protein GLX27_003867 [Malassezia furfur]|uniref:Uncharacterized protein n=1 Tax=Malassezia furfur TaxID=55194 RepID=A0ABY8EWQ9_MALFU|nr:hypothetical protein GLX27_003867 [Malassezia furfur]
MHLLGVPRGCRHVLRRRRSAVALLASLDGKVFQRREHIVVEHLDQVRRRPTAPVPVLARRRGAAREALEPKLAAIAQFRRRLNGQRFQDRQLLALLGGQTRFGMELVHGACKRCHHHAFPRAVVRVHKRRPVRLLEHDAARRHHAATLVFARRGEARRRQRVGRAREVRVLAHWQQT